MALTWKVENVKDAWREISIEEYNSSSDKLIMFQNPRHYNELKDKYYEMKTELNMFIFICGLFSGIPDITIDNYERLYERIRFLELTQESSYLTTYNPKTKEKVSKPITLDMVQSFIGLQTNGNYLTKAQFIKQATHSWKV